MKHFSHDLQAFTTSKLMTAALAGATLLTATPLLAQGYGNPDYQIPGYGLIVQTPEIQLGSDLTPSIVKIPSVVVQSTPAEWSAATWGDANPAGIEPLARRHSHFDYIVEPAQGIIPGSMEDTSISLGDYVRQLRAGKAHRPAPDATAKPAESH